MQFLKFPLGHLDSGAVVEVVLAESVRCVPR